VNAIIDWLLSSVHQVDGILRDAIAGLAILLETSLFVGLIVPGDTVVLLAATSVSGWFDALGLLGFVLLGSVLGESTGFWLGRFFGLRIRNSKLGKMIGDQNWRLADSFVESRGGIAVAISRFLPFLHSVVPVTAGMSKMTYKTFITWTAGACLVWASVYVGLGFLASASYEQLASKIKFGGYIFIAVLALVVIGFHFGKKRLESMAEKMIESNESKQDKKGV
jgi:membrane protein DedA with SNARE-associated domain